MNMFEISKTFYFEAAHSLPYLPEGHKCKNLHGHSYRFEIVCRGELNEQSFVVDFSEISKVGNAICAILDHKNLNNVLHFHTTAEKICQWIFEKVKPSLPVFQVHLYETAKTKVTYPV